MYYINIFLEPDKVQLITPGLSTDIAFGALSDLGYDVRVMNVTDFKGYLNSSQEKMMDSAIQQRATALVHGLEDSQSFMDQLISLESYYEISGSVYTMVDGRMVCQDYCFQTNVQRTKRGGLKFDTSIVHLPELVSILGDDSTLLPVIPPPGIYYCQEFCTTSILGASISASSTSDLIAARYQLHRGIVERTESYMWLLDSHYFVRSGVMHPLDHPDSMSVQMTTMGTLVINRSSLKRLVFMESIIYNGSCKSWLVPVAQFPTMNPEKCRRFVRILYFVLY